MRQESELNMKFNTYAKLLIQDGLNVQKNQIVVIKAPVEVHDFVALLVEEAYASGAKDVIVRYVDSTIAKLRYLHSEASVFESVPDYEAQFYNETSEKGACYLTLVGEDPDAMKGVDPNRMANYQKAFRLATKPYRNRLDFMENQWCIAAVATQEWATKVYPDVSKEEATDRLWESIFKVSRIDTCWQDRKQSFETITHKLNGLGIEKLHYTNALGTDLWVELPDHYLFVGGGSMLKNGTYYFPNIPTEEVFGAPKRTGVNGRLVASMPLNHNGSLIDSFWFEFKDGAIVDYDAKVGKDVLQSIIESDEGSKYLGEIALVPYDSPISNMHTIFYETLIDENASCHFAIGASYAECLDGGLEMDEDTLLEHGMNQSTVHVDFMVGTSDLTIDAYTKEGVVSIFTHGNYSDDLFEDEM